MEILQKEPLRLAISNDAFYCLYYDEEPIDDIFLDEAKKVAAMFPNGYIIAEDWQSIEDTGLIEATFLAIAAKPDWPTHYLNVFNGWKLLFRLLSKEVAKIQIWHETKPVEPPEELRVEYLNDKPWITTKQGSKFPLWNRIQKWA